jgi:hypothetical protein
MYRYKEIIQNKVMDLNIESLKKRGRKKKEISEEDKPPEKKKRGRKKKWESFAHTKIVMPDSDEDQNVNPTHDPVYNSNYEKESVAFGNLSITVHANKDVNNTLKIKDSIFKNVDTIKKASVCKIELDNSDLDDDSDTEHRPNYKPNMVKKTIKYHKDIYTSESELSRTDVYCYNCCHPFYNKPFTLPIDFDANLKRYKVFGNFCSPNCAKRYAMDDKNLCNKVHILSHMCREMYDASYKIKPAPSKFLLRCFGGKLSIEEYRNNFKDDIKYVIKPVDTKTLFLEIVEI